MSYLIFEIRCVIYTFLAHLSADGATFQEARWPHVASGYCMSQSFSRRKQIPTGHPDGTWLRLGSLHPVALSSEDGVNQPLICASSSSAVHSGHCLVLLLWLLFYPLFLPSPTSFFLFSQGNHPRGVGCPGMQVPPLEPELGGPTSGPRGGGGLQMEIRALFCQQWERLLGGGNGVLWTCLVG